jgi:hypothetical protein
MDLIKRFNDYFNKLEEALNTPSEIDWSKENNNLIGFFDINDIKYKIECLKQIGNNYAYLFSFYDTELNDWSFRLTNKGLDSFKVLSTIKEGLNYVFKNLNPNSVIFSAIDNSDSRKRIYLTFCETFCKENSLLFLDKGTNDRKIYLLYKDNLSSVDKEEIMESLIKVIEIGKD